MPKKIEPIFFNMHQAAQYLNKSWGYLNMLIESGHLQTYSLPGVKRRMLKRADLDCLIQRGPGAISSSGRSGSRA